MLRISSGWTLIYKIFIPVFYTVFMLAWIIATIGSGDEVSPVFTHWMYRIGIVLVFILAVLLMRYTVWKLKRMDVATDHIFITDYFKTYRYSLESIESISHSNVLFWKFLKVKLKEKGSLGDSFTVLIEEKVWESWIMNNEKYRILLK